MAYNGSGSNSPGAKEYDDAHRLQDLGHPNTSVSFARAVAMNPPFSSFFLLPSMWANTLFPRF